MLDDKKKKTLKGVLADIEASANPASNQQGQSLPPSFSEQDANAPQMSDAEFGALANRYGSPGSMSNLLSGGKRTVSDVVKDINDEKKFVAQGAGVDTSNYTTGKFLTDVPKAYASGSGIMFSDAGKLMGIAGRSIQRNKAAAGALAATSPFAAPGILAGDLFGKGEEVRGAIEKGASYLAGKVGQGIESLEKPIQNVGERTSEFWTKQQSKEGRQLTNRAFYKTGGIGNMVMSAILQSAQSAPETVAIGMAGTPVASLLEKAGFAKKMARVIERSGISRKVAPKIAEWVMEGMSYGSMEGIDAGLQNATQVSRIIESKSDEDLKKTSPVYRKYLGEGNTPKQARWLLKEDAEGLALGATTLMSTATGAIAGAGVFDKTITNQHFLLNTVLSGLKEGNQEFWQSGIGEQIPTNLAIRKINGDQPTMEDVWGQGLAGAGPGFVMGLFGGELSKGKKPAVAGASLELLGNKNVADLRKQNLPTSALRKIRQNPKTMSSLGVDEKGVSALLNERASNLLNARVLLGEDVNNGPLARTAKIGIQQEDAAATKDLFLERMKATKEEGEAKGAGAAGVIQLSHAKQLVDMFSAPKNEEERKIMGEEVQKVLGDTRIEPAARKYIEDSGILERLGVKKEKEVTPAPPAPMETEWKNQEAASATYRKIKNRKKETLTPEMLDFMREYEKGNETNNGPGPGGGGTGMASVEQVSDKEFKDFQKKVQLERQNNINSSRLKKIQSDKKNATATMSRTDILPAIKKSSRSEAENIMRRDPVYGHMLDAKKHGKINLKLSSSSVDHHLANEISARHPGVFSSRGELLPEDFASKHGYQSVNEMLETFAQAKTKKELAASLAIEAHGRSKGNPAAADGQEQASMTAKAAFPAKESTVKDVQKRIKKDPSSITEDELSGWAYSADQKAALRRTYREAIAGMMGQAEPLTVGGLKNDRKEEGRVARHLPQGQEPGRAIQGQERKGSGEKTTQTGGVFQKVSGGVQTGRQGELVKPENPPTGTVSGNGIYLVTFKSREGNDRILATGNTFEYKKNFKRLPGARWNSTEKGWSFPVDVEDELRSIIHAPKKSEISLPFKEEKRTDLEKRRAVDEMSRDEMKKALLTDNLTGLGNGRAYAEARKEGKEKVIFIDADNLKFFNDNGGHEAGDKLLMSIGSAIKEHTDKGFHLHGDEFVILVKDKHDGERLVAKIKKTLSEDKQNFEHSGSKWEAVPMISYGIGDNKGEADAQMQIDKRSRKEAGLASARGGVPPGIVKVEKGEAKEERAPSVNNSPATPSEYGAKNKLVSAARAEELRKKMRAKLNALSAGLDPELMSMGMELAVYHIEAGARKFSEFVKKMVADFGDKVKPFLGSFYDSARRYPGVDRKQMSPASEIDAYEKILEKEAAGKIGKVGKPRMKSVASFTNKEDGVTASVYENLEEGTFHVVTLDDSGEVLPSVTIFDNKGKAEEKAQSIVGISGAKGGPTNEKTANTGANGRDGSVRMGTGSQTEGTNKGGVESNKGRGEAGATGREGVHAGRNGGESGNVGSEGNDVSEKVNSKETDGRRAGNYRLTPETVSSIEKRSESQRISDNMLAIRKLNELKENNRQATIEEQKILASFSGWGGLIGVFNENNKRLTLHREELKKILSEEEFASARSSARNAHFTAPSIVTGIYNAMTRLGVRGGGKMLEPSVGVGNFLGLMPSRFRAGTIITGVELDSITGGIAKLLYPDANIVAPIGFQEIAFAPGSFDFAIGNPPFSQTSLSSKHFKAKGEAGNTLKQSVHNFFFSRTINALRPGGVMGMVVSHYLMDKQDNVDRVYMATQAELVGAIRLPDTAFMGNTGTSVTSDIMFFRKRAVPISWKDAEKEAWVNTFSMNIEEGEPVNVSQYYKDHPDMMLGTMSRKGSMYGPDQPSLSARPGQDLDNELDMAVSKLPSSVYTKRSEEESVVEIVKDKEIPLGTKINAYFVTKDGHLRMRLPDNEGLQISTPATRWNNAQKKEVSLNAVQVSRIKAMILVRDSLARLIDAEKGTSISDNKINIIRGGLNRVYDKFVTKHGYAHQQANKLAFGSDPDYPRLLALEENYTAEITRSMSARSGAPARKATASKADIFTERSIVRQKEIKEVKSANDALMVSLNESGAIDIDRMSELTGKDEQQLLEELADTVFEDPQNGYVTKDEYLSGNVKAKLAAATIEARRDGKFLKNVEALKLVQPKDFDPVDIHVRLSSPWLDENTLSEFGKHLLGAKVSAKFNSTLGAWEVEIGSADMSKNKKWGTDFVSGAKLLDKIIRNRTVSVRTRSRETGKIEFDLPETQAAEAKAQEIVDEFKDWIWDGGPNAVKRRVGLVKRYNDTYNTDVEQVFDGGHMTFPGMTKTIQLAVHQKAGVWRAIQQGRVLFDHVVGSGKTFEMIATALEMKRMGLLNKPMFTVPNHLIEQWSSDFYRLYPGVKLLSATKKDFQPQNRQKFFARIATGNWDAVLVPHSSFGMIATPKEEHLEFLNEEIQNYEDAIRQMISDRDGTPRNIVKQVENVRDKLKEEHAKISERQEDVMDFGEMGIDALFVDEAHKFKNLGIATRKGRIPGLGSLSGAMKSKDLFTKVRMIQKRNKGKGVFFATGTPVSNTLAEMFTMQRYMDMDSLRQRRIAHFDAWSDVFADTATNWELDATGVRYAPRTSFSSFVNLGAMMRMYKSFADIVSMKKLMAIAKKAGKVWPIPKVKGGAPTRIIVDRSELQAAYMDYVIYRAEHMDPKDLRTDNMLKLTTDATKAALDMRLIDPTAQDYAGSKPNRVVAEAIKIYREWNSRKGTQLIFLDYSAPKKWAVNARERYKKNVELAEKGNVEAQNRLDKMNPAEISALQSSFSVYDDMKTKLLASGIPADQVMFIHDANTDKQKEALMEKVRNGEIRILIGSTAKMGEGMNVQRRLVALHHVDAPWRPSDLEQREGRILRQGNKFYEENPDKFEVTINRYGTKQTYDARRWQIIERKANIVDSLRDYDVNSGINTIEDISGESANAAEMKAAASGDPRIMEQVQLAGEITKLNNMKTSHRRRKQRAEIDISVLESQLEKGGTLDQGKAQADSYVATGKENKKSPFKISIGGVVFEERPAREIKEKDFPSPAEYRAARAKEKKDSAAAKTKLIHKVEVAIKQVVSDRLGTNYPDIRYFKVGIEYRGMYLWGMNRATVGWGVEGSGFSLIGVPKDLNANALIWTIKNEAAKSYNHAGFSPSGLVTRMNNVLDTKGVDMLARVTYSKERVENELVAEKENLPGEFPQDEELKEKVARNRKLTQELMTDSASITEIDPKKWRRILEEEKGEAGDKVEPVKPMFSVSEKVTSGAEANVRKELQDAFGKFNAMRLLSDGPVQVDTKSEAARIIKQENPEDIIYAQDSGNKIVAGFVLNGKVHLVEGNISAGNVSKVLVHELAVHLRKLGFRNTSAFSKVLQMVGNRAGMDSSDGRAVREAMNSIPGNTKKADIPEETLAYLIQQGKLDVGPVRSLIASIKQFLVDKMKFSPKILKNIDLQAIAMKVVKRELKGYSVPGKNIVSPVATEDGVKFSLTEPPKTKQERIIEARTISNTLTLNATRDGVTSSSSSDYGEKIIESIMNKLAIASPTMRNYAKVSRAMASLIEEYQSVAKTINDPHASVATKQKFAARLAMKLPAESRARLLQRLSKISRVKREDTQHRYLIGFMKQANRVLSRQLRTKIISDIEKSTRPLKMRADRILRGRGHELERDLKYLRDKAMRTHTPLEIMTELSRLDVLREHAEKNMAEAQSVAKPNQSKIENIQEDLDNISSYDILINIFGGLGSQNIYSLANARQILEEMVYRKRNSWRESQKIIRENNADNQEMAAREISGQDHPRLENVSEKRIRELKEKSVTGKLKELLSAGSNSIQSWELMLDKVAGKSGAGILQSKLVTKFASIAHVATRKYEKMQMDTLKDLSEKASEIFGVSRGREMAKLFARLNEPQKNKIFLYTDKGKEQIPLAPFQAAYWYQISKDIANPAVSRTFERMGITQDTLKQMEKMMGPELQRWADYLVDDFYQDFHYGVNEVYRNIEGIDLEKNVNYVPWYREVTGKVSDAMEKGFLHGVESGSIKKGSLRSRVMNANSFRTMSLNDVLMNHVTDMNHYKAWAIPSREINGTFNNRVIQNLIRANYGLSSLKAIQRFQKDFVKSPNDNYDDLSGLDHLRSKLTVAMVGANPVIFLKQLTSIPAYAAEVPLHKWMAYTAYAMSHPVEVSRILGTSTMIQSRYKRGFERDIANAMRRGSGDVLAISRGVPDKMMILASLGDKMAIVAGGFAVYRHNLDIAKSEGLKGEKAKAFAMQRFEMATERSQQSSHVKDLGWFQRGTPLMKIFTMFMTTPASYSRLLFMSMRHLKNDPARAAKTLFIYGVVLPLAFQAVSDAFLLSGKGPDDKKKTDNDWEWRALRAILLGPFNGLPVIRTIMQGYANVIDNKYFRQEYSPVLSAVGKSTKLVSDLHKWHKGGSKTIGPHEYLMRAAWDMGVLAGYRAGVPVEPIGRIVGGMKAAIAGKTKYPVRRSIGYSAYVLGEKK